jgi:predicted TIM-barrel fold metal-dependent hydrolase
MNFTGLGAIDCDVHPAVPNLRALFPYLEEHWCDSIIQRGMDDLETISYPANAPITARSDWRPATGKPAGTLELLRDQALLPWGISQAICNPLYGVHLVFSEDMAAAFARAVNDWMVHEWLDREPRLRASIVIPMQSVDFAVEEIERCAADRRFVQVLVMVMGDMPLGRRHYWPIYAAAERHGLPIGVHAGSSYRNPVTPVGWPSYYMEDYAAQAVGFQSQLTSLICEGVFSKFAELKFVFLESGFAWLPGYLWRLTKFWRSLRTEIPWVDRTPGEIVRDRVRFTLQPMDAPTDPAAFARLLEHLESDRLLLFSSDYPHWQFDGDAALPQGLSPDLVQRILVDNPRETYPRLTECAA